MKHTTVAINVPTVDNILRAMAAQSMTWVKVCDECDDEMRIIVASDSKKSLEILIEDDISAGPYVAERRAVVMVNDEEVDEVYSVSDLIEMLNDDLRDHDASRVLNARIRRVLSYEHGRLITEEELVEKFHQFCNEYPDHLFELKVREDIVSKVDPLIERIFEEEKTHPMQRIVNRYLRDFDHVPSDKSKVSAKEVEYMEMLIGDGDDCGLKSAGIDVDWWQFSYMELADIESEASNAGII